MVTWLRMSELCARLNRAESTLLLWHRMYGPWLPRHRDDQGVYVYPLEAYEEVVELTADASHHPSDVRRELTHRHGGEDVDIGRMGGTVTHLARLTDRLEEMYRGLAGQIEDVSARLDEIERRLSRD